MPTEDCPAVRPGSLSNRLDISLPALELTEPPFRVAAFKRFQPVRPAHARETACNSTAPARTKATALILSAHAPAASDAVTCGSSSVMAANARRSAVVTDEELFRRRCDAASG